MLIIILSLSLSLLAPFSRFSFFLSHYSCFHALSFSLYHPSLSLYLFTHSFSVPLCFFLSLFLSITSFHYFLCAIKQQYGSNNQLHFCNPSSNLAVHLLKKIKPLQISWPCFKLSCCTRLKQIF